MPAVRLQEAGEKDVFLRLFNQPSVQTSLNRKQWLWLYRLYLIRLLVVLIIKGREPLTAPIRAPSTHA
jgi:hypothetical protein